MKKIALIFIITTILLVITTEIILLTNIEGRREATKQKETVTENICEHDWVITSEYSWFRNQYRTISKCSKCGETVK